MINGVAALSVSLFQRREAHPHAMLSGVVSLGAGLFAALFPGVLMKSITLAIGLWSLLVCVAQVGYVVQLIVMGERGRIKFALLAALSLVTGVSLLWGYSAGRALQWLAGVYLLLYALWQLMDLVGVLINRNVEKQPSAQPPARASARAAHGASALRGAQAAKRPVRDAYAGRGHAQALARA